MHSPFALWVSTCRFGLEAQQVIVARLLGFSRVDAAAPLEAACMVNEKIAAFFEGQLAAGVALAAGQSGMVAVAKFARPYRRRVRANHRRLHPRRR
jgi:hypothetical protein